MRRSYTILLTIGVLLSMVMSVQALQSKTIERNNGASASASWDEINGDITTNTYLTVTETNNDYTDIFLEIYTYNTQTGETSWKTGFMSTNDEVFNIDKKLNSASLSEVKIDVNDWDTGVTETVTIKADWIDKGKISRDSYTSRSKSGNYMWKSSSITNYRDASATGSINGLNLGASSYANMNVFKNAYISMEK